MYSEIGKGIHPPSRKPVVPADGPSDVTEQRRNVCDMDTSEPNSDVTAEFAYRRPHCALRGGPVIDSDSGPNHPAPSLISKKKTGERSIPVLKMSEAENEMARNWELAAIRRTSRSIL